MDLARSVIIHKDNANKIFDSNALSMTISVQLTRPYQTKSPEYLLACMWSYYLAVDEERTWTSVSSSGVSAGAGAALKVVVVDDINNSSSKLLRRAEECRWRKKSRRI